MGGLSNTFATGGSFSFGNWTLDPRTGAPARLDGPATTLRPKTAAVLAELLATPGHLVSRDTLLERVWPGVTVTDDSLTQCVAEIRRVLGEDARLLRTAPRRGYVMDAPPLLTRALQSEATNLVTTGAPPGRRPGLRWPIAAGVAVACAAVGIGVAASLELYPLQSGPAEEQRLVHEGRVLFYGSGDRRDVWPRARTLFLRAHEADPASPEPDAWAAFTYTNMILAGLSEDRAHDLAEAVRLADRAIARGPNLGLAWVARAAVYRLEGRPDQALDAYRRGVSLDPSQIPAKANAGWMLVLLGRPQEALQLIRAALAATRDDHPFRPTWQCYLGVAQLAAGEGDLGQQALRTTIGKDAVCIPQAERLLYLAAGDALRGDTDDARLLVSQVRQQWPAETPEALERAALSDNPAYLAQRETLFRGLALAGFSAASP